MEHDEAKGAPAVVVSEVEPKPAFEETQEKIEPDLAKDDVKVATSTSETMEGGVDPSFVKHDEPKADFVSVINGVEPKCVSEETLNEEIDPSLVKLDEPKVAVRASGRHIGVVAAS